MLVNKLIKNLRFIDLLILHCLRYIFVNITKFFEFFSKELQMNIQLLKD
jgi:hypothetical protein